MSKPTERDHVHPSRERRRRLFVCLAVTVLSACAWIYFENRSSIGSVAKSNVANAETDVRINPEVTPQLDNVSGDTTASPSVEVLPALLPEDLPLSAQLPVLLARATRGDPVASCRLAVEAVRCSTHQLVGRFSDKVFHADSPSVRTLARAPTGDTLLSNDEHCANFDRKSIGDLDALLERNKPALNVQQKVLIALIQPDGAIMTLPREIQRGVIGSATTLFVYSQFQADNALAFLEEGLLAHNRLALEGLILVHTPSDIPGFRPGVRLALPNPRQFVGLSFLLVEVFGPDALGPIVSQTVSNVLQTMDLVAISKLREQARARAATWKYQLSPETQKREALASPRERSDCSR